MEAEFSAAPIAAPQARRHLSSLDGLPPSVREEAALLVSELVANAVRHGEFQHTDSIVVETEATQKKLRVAVTNPGWGDVPHVKHAQPLDTGGRGLFLVDRLADAWGMDLLEDERMCVWFEIHL